MRRAPLVLLGVYLAGGCSQPEPLSVEGPLVLSRAPERVTSLELPQDNRPDGAATPQEWTFAKPFELNRSVEGVDEYAAPLPARILYYGSTNKKSPPEMSLLDSSGDTWEFEARRDKIGSVHTWSYSQGKIFIRLPEGAEPPPFTVRLPVATASEDALNLVRSELDPISFALRSIPAAKAWRQGLYLPTPASMSFAVTVPANGRLSFRAQLLAPPVDTGASSDGAVVVVEATRAGVDLELGRQFLAPGDSQYVAVDLSSHVGAELELRIRTLPVGNSQLDYVLIGDPSLYTPETDPRRVLLVFVDTLRPDRMGLYGHDRDTTPVLDALAAEAVVFDQARAPSSWTLPSGRSSVTGRWPDRWDAGPHLGELLGQEGWATVAVVTNSYMTEAFGMAQGWSVHQSNMGIRADKEVRRALDLIEDYEDRDLLLWLHLIDPHLPYTEAKPFQDLWAGERPAQLKGTVNDKSVLAAWEACESDTEREALTTYLWDRYDQNIRATDAALEPILEAMGDDALVVLYSDHGEEFWEHGVMGHGHSLSEEQLRVPLIIRDPSLPAGGRVQAPVSLLDIAPTVLDLLDISLPDGDDAMDGASLKDAAQSEPKALQFLEERPLAFGRILFSNDSWGVVMNGHKWVSSGLQEQLFDLQTDPTEDHDLLKEKTLDTQPYLDALATRLERPVTRVWRADAYGEHVFIEPHTAELWFSHPDGTDEAWTRWDPMAKRTLVDYRDGQVGLHRDETRRSPRELFITPASTPVGARLELRIGPRIYTDTLTAAELSTWKPGEAMMKIGPPDRPAYFGWTVQPAPQEQVQNTLSPDIEEALEAMGYLE